MMIFRCFRCIVSRMSPTVLQLLFLSLWMTLYTPTMTTAVDVAGLNIIPTSQEQLPVEENEGVALVVLDHEVHSSKSNDRMSPPRSKLLPPVALTVLPVETDVSVWPFSHHDTNHNHSNSSSDSNNSGNSSDSYSSSDKVCIDATSCERCNSYYTCHWCAHDSTCHAIGSVYGCMIGSKCTDEHKKKPNLDPNDTATGCSAHTTCRDCTLSSHLCHWCGHDNMCHAVGSVYGCITGVDCYDNQHCQRTLPEPVRPSRSSSSRHRKKKSESDSDTNTSNDVPIDQHNIGILPLVLIISIATILMCCTTSCCCILNCLKSAYDDLAISTTMIPTTTGTAPSDPQYEHDTDEYSPLLPETQQQHQQILPLLSAPTATITSTQSGEDDNFYDCNASTTGTETTTTTSIARPKDPNVIADNEIESQIQPALEGTAMSAVMTKDDCYVRMEDIEENQDHDETSPTTTTTTTTTTTSTRTNAIRISRPHRQHQHQQQRRRRFVAMQQLYMTCMGCYVFTILFIAFFTYVAIYYFPQKPIYNICNDSVAWNSLMDSMTSFKATAEFQILASVYNPNLLDVAVDMGKGSFAHGGEIVGTYEIPPTLIVSQSITDLLIIARFTPEKWQALSITAEYYSGNLVLHVNADASIRIPALLDYTISTSLQDIVVHVNALSDRRLCSCPTWSNNNSTSYYNNHRTSRPPLEL